MQACSVPSTGGYQELLRKELGSIRGVHNGLYYPPFLLSMPAGPEANSYAMRILRLGGTEPQLSLESADVAFVRSEALSSSSIDGIMWLASLQRAAGQTLVRDDDISRLRGLRGRDGLFSDSPVIGSSTDDHDATLHATEAALWTLNELGLLTEEDRSVTLTALRDEIRTVVDPVRAGMMARILSNVGAPHTYAEGLAKAMSGVRWDDSPDTPDRLLESMRRAHGLISVAAAVGVTPSPQEFSIGTWRRVIAANAKSMEYRDGYMLASIVISLGGSAVDIAPLLDRVAQNRLPRGLIREPRLLAGSPEATLYVLRLQRMLGDRIEDPDIARAVESGEPARSPAEEATVTAVRRLASPGRVSGGPRPRACENSGAGIGAAVSLDSASGWLRLALACRDAGYVLTPPQVRPWSLDDPRGTVAAAQLVVGFEDSGTDPRAIGWIDAEALGGYVRHAERLPRVYDFAVTVRAFLLLGGKLTSEDVARVRERVDGMQGCTGLRSMYRVSPNDSECDLLGTWAVVALRSMGDADDATRIFND